MEATKDHISLETAKLLKNCGVESKLTCHETVWNKGTKDEERWMVVHSTNFIKEQAIERGYTIYPAYTWQEILWENPKEFFGEKNHYQVTINNLHESGFDFIATEILIFLQQKKYKEADEYFRKHCIFIHS